MRSLLVILPYSSKFIDGSFCRTETNKICEKPETGCTAIIGDVKIDSDTDLKVFKTMESISGTLTINGTDIRDFGFLESLEYLAYLDHGKKIL
uniref:Recep_L_domain domain-containing protein n=1 Tax=Caenorhabditis tropicalis TaxID=1561998 RepID=A0A1I7UEQ2_9PELO